MSMRRLLRKYGRGLKIDIERLPARKVRVQLNGALSSFFAYTVGDRLLWIDYDQPSGQVKQYYDCETRGPFCLNGEDCLELHSDFYERVDGRFKLETRSDLYVAVRKTEAVELLWLHRDTTAPERKPIGNIQIRDVATPRNIRLGDRWQFTERWFYKGAKDEPRITETADGLFRVRVFDREYETMRVRSVNRGKKKCSLADNYVALDTGLSVFFRRFNGPGWHNLDALCSEEEVVVGRTRFRHWYDSVPFRA